jgi:HPP family
MSRKRDLLIAPAGEAFLLLIAALAGWLCRQPLIFASLGPTAYELIETPHRRSARPYSILTGQLVAIGSGYLALVATRAWSTPPVSSSGVPLDRVWAVVLAAALTVLFTLLLHASQPAALSTTLLIATGILQQPRDAVAIMGAVVLMILIGEPLRRLRLRQQEGAKTAAESQ